MYQFDMLGGRSTVKIFNLIRLVVFQRWRSSIWYVLYQDQRSISSIWYIWRKISSEYRLLDVFWPWSTVNINFWVCFAEDQRSTSTFGCVLILINGQDWLLNLFICSRSTVNIDFWMCFAQDQQSTSTFGCVLILING